MLTRGGGDAIHNRWVQLGASLIAMIMIANLQYSWTLFVEPMRTATGWKLSDIQWAFTLFILFQTWVQPPRVADRPSGPPHLHDRRGVLCGIGWTGLGVATSLPMLYALYSGRDRRGADFTAAGWARR